jgi:serine/threonine-protein kinase ULK/ATG1
LVIHKLNFIHRDLKPQNILLSEDSEQATLKIADFGFARSLQPFDMAATICGSPLYMAPEILRHERYDGRADLWSVGAIIFELIWT